MTEPWPDGWDPHLAVKHGAVWLDETRPGWERSIDLSTFAIVDSCRCVLGQVFGEDIEVDGFALALDEHVIDTDDLGFTVKHSRANGEWMQRWYALDEAWIDLIRERQS